MEELIEKIATFIKKNSIIVFLILFVVIDIAFSPVIFSQNQEKIFLQKDSLQNLNVENIPKISNITGPLIDDQAASIEKIVVTEKVSTHASLPIKIWMFLLLAYVVLLIFNLTYNFKNAIKIQWSLELGLTFLTLFVWYAFDSGRVNIWYPMAVLKVGILIYALYLYFFNKKQENK